MSRLRRALLGAALLLMLTLAAFAGSRIAARGRFAVPYSTHSGGPLGTRALYELAGELGWRTARWTRELSGLPQGAILVAASGCGGETVRPLSRPEREALKRWVARGGHLIVAGLDDYADHAWGLRLDGEPSCEEPAIDLQGLLQPVEEELAAQVVDAGPEDDAGAPLDAGAGVAADAGADAGRPAQAQVAGEVDDGLLMSVAPEPPTGPLPWRVRARPAPGPLAHLLPFDIEGARRVDAGAEGQVLLESDAGPLIARREVGEGSVTLLGTGSLWQNRALGERGAALFERLLRATGSAGPVLFDEYHLGLGEQRSLVRYLRDVHAGPAMLQGLLAALLWLLVGGARLGELRPAPANAPEGGASYVRAMGALYGRSEDAEGAAQVLARRALDRVADHYRVRHVPRAQLVATLRAHGHGAAAHFAERIEAQGRASVRSAAELLDVSRQIDADLQAALVLVEGG